ncbi:hypothetical protein J7643_03715 [bacterium]|nr:hypothetical protein [bacterium]
MRAQQIKVPVEPPAAPTSTDTGTAPTIGGPREFTLADGRTILMSKPRGAYSLRIFEWLGPQNSANEMLIIHYRAILHVRRIDSQEEATPQTKLQLEALAQKLGDEALDEVASAYLEYFVAGSPGLRPL